jgi:hypothetical protein
MFTYECFYKSKRISVKAFRSYDAQREAAKIFKARKSWEVTVVLAADQFGEPIIHSTASL